MDATQFDTLLERIKADDRSPEDLAKASGVPLGTLNKIIRGHTPNPRIRTVEKLQKVYTDLSPVS